MAAVGELGPDGTALKRLVHRTIAQVTVELERLHFNKAVALVRELSNAVEAFAPATDGDRALLREALETVVVLLGPDGAASGRGALAGFGTRAAAGRDTPGPRRIRPGSIADSVIVPVQVNGKRRAELELPRGAVRWPRWRHWRWPIPPCSRAMEGKPPRRVVVVPDKIVNVVV